MTPSLVFGSGADESGRQRAWESSHGRQRGPGHDIPLGIREAHGKQLSVCSETKDQLKIGLQAHPAPSSSHCCFLTEVLAMPLTQVPSANTPLMKTRVRRGVKK